MAYPSSPPRQGGGVILLPSVIGVSVNLDTGQYLYYPIRPILDSRRRGRRRLYVGRREGGTRRRLHDRVTLLRVSVRAQPPARRLRYCAATVTPRGAARRRRWSVVDDAPQKRVFSFMPSARPGGSRPPAHPERALLTRNGMASIPRTYACPLVDGAQSYLVVRGSLLVAFVV